LGYYDTATVISKVADRKLTYTPVDDDTFSQTATRVGLPRDYAVSGRGLSSNMRSIMRSPLRAHRILTSNQSFEPMIRHLPR
jgi:hypothetical protein